MNSHPLKESSQTLLTSVALLVLALVPPAASGEIVFTGMEPSSGPAGTEVTLSGSGWGGTGAPVLTVGGMSADILEVDDSFIRFRVPNGATTGPVEITTDGQTYRYSTFFTVTRNLVATIDPASGIGPAGYTVGTMYGDAAGEGPDYLIEVALGAPSLVGASGAEEEPALMAVVTDDVSALVLSAQSTAQAMLFMVPGVQVLEPEEAERRLDFIAAMPSIASLAQSIQTALAAGNDYIDQPAVDAAFLEAVEAFNESYTPPPDEDEVELASERREDFVNTTETFATGYPRDLTLEGLELLRKLESKVVTVAPDPRGLPVLGVKVDTRSSPAGAPGRNFKANPLDWSAVLYELDPTDSRLSSLALVNALEGDYSAVYARRNPAPLDRLHIQAKFVFARADLVGMLTDLLIGPIKPAFVQKEHLNIPADRPGLYMIRAYSGAYFPHQRTLLSNLPDGLRETDKMIFFNVMLAANDAMGILVGPVADDCFTKFILSLEKKLGTVISRELAQQTWNSEVVLLLFLEASKAYVQDYFVKCVLLDTSRRGLAGSAKVAIKTVNVLGKVASFGKLAERINALGNLQRVLTPGDTEAWIAQSVEDTIVVVGNPWGPVITSFYPQAGYRGEVVCITGRHFSSVTNENLVTFGFATTDPENPPAPARAEVLNATSTSLVVRVPEEAQTGPITVTVAGSGSSITVDLPEKFQVFTVQDDPVITHIVPAAPVVGQPMEIHGMHFAPSPDGQLVEFSATGNIIPKVGNRQVLFLRAPSLATPNSVKVRIGDRESNELEFTPVLPEVILAGAIITVSSAADNNVRDGDITLREALLLASGELEYDHLNSPPDPRPPNTRYETDHVQLIHLGDDQWGRPGPGSRDEVRCSFEVTLSSPLPVLASYDTYSIAGVDGDGLSGDAFRMDGVTRTTLAVGSIRNFNGNGIVFAGGAHDNLIGGTKIAQCSGDGIRFEGSATGNVVDRVQVTECGNGIHLTGDGVRFNEIQPLFEMDYHRLDQHQQFGLLIDSGASFNLVTAYSVRSNGSGGIRIAGADTVGNRVEGVGLANQTEEIGRVFDNGGPGIWISSPANFVYGFNVAGNAGDGVLIEDDVCRDMTIWGIRAGYDTLTGAAHPNEGSGIRVRNGANNLAIGLPEHDVSNGITDFSNERNYLGGNRDHGLLIEGADTRNIAVTLTSAGWVSNRHGNPFATPNGEHGIALLNGANNVTIGGAYKAINVTVANQTNGAGIYIAGANTSSNRVFGCRFGPSAISSIWSPAVRQGNRYGIQIANDAYANVIGERGSPYQLSFSTFVRNYESRNLIQGNLEAGILLEAGGDPTGTSTSGETPTGGNVIQNNWIGGDPSLAGYENRVGILIRQGAESNRIGGSSPEEANHIGYNTHAGIQIDGAVIARPERANRIIGNELRRNGFRVTDPGDPLAGTPDGIGISIINGASGHFIGGSTLAEANDIWENHVGVHIAGSAQNQFRNNRIRQSKIGGIVLLDSDANRIGPGNEVFRNGSATAVPIGGLGGLTLKGSANNLVLGNWIGMRTEMKFPSSTDGNIPHGIALFDSPDNVIGELAGDGANVIVASGTHGVLISGGDSSGNQVAANHIGLSSVPGGFATANKETGVMLADQAHSNLIGGRRPVKVKDGLMFRDAPNVISRNSTGGVRVEGAGTVGNSILNNQIFNHTGGLGIATVSGGNSEIPPPTVVAVDPLNLSGTVDTARVSDGSLVEIFSDDADEGQAKIAEAIVAGGAFSARLGGLPPLANINATVTHAVSGSTSEFSPLTVLPNFLGLELKHVAPPVERDLPLDQPNAVVQAFTLRAFGGPVLVRSIRFQATGSADEPSAIAGLSLYRSIEDEEPRLLVGPRLAGSNDGLIFFTQIDAIVDPSEPQEWFLAVELSTNVVVGETLSFEISNETFVSSRGLFPGTTIVETGEFSLLSDTLRLIGGTGSAGRFTSIRREGNDLILEWSGPGVLEEAPEVSGQWTLVPDATTPFTFTFEHQKRFFRLVMP